MRILLVTPTFAGSLGDMVHRTLADMGHQLFPFDYRAIAFGPDYRQRSVISVADRLKYYAQKIFRDPIRRMNQGLIEYAAQIKPKLTLVIKGELINSRAVATLNHNGSKIVLWYPDTSTRLLERRSRIGTASLPHYDVCFFCDIEHLAKNLAQTIKHIEYLTFACDPKLHKKVDLSPSELTYYQSDICFVGNPHGDWSIRNKILGALLDFNIKIWGHEWQRAAIYDQNPQRFGSALYDSELVKAYNATKIALNINGDYPYLNLRNFETPACGPLVITSDVPDLKRCFKIDEEVVSFASIPDLRQKLAYFLDHKAHRQAIAHQGYLRTHREHTLRHRLEQLLQITFEKR